MLKMQIADWKSFSFHKNRLFILKIRRSLFKSYFEFCTCQFWQEKCCETDCLRNLTPINQIEYSNIQWV